MSFKEDIGKKWLCPLPFMHTTMRQGGVYATCCEAWRTNIKIDEVSPIEFFNSEHSQDLRKAFLTDQPQNEPIVQNACRKCIGAEESFGYSKRTRDSQELKLDSYKYLEKNYNIAQKDINQHIEPHMDFIKIECGNTCNLKCVMCVPSASSLIGGYVYDPDFTDEVYKDLDKILKNCTKLQFAGGEPLLLKNSCLKVIQWCIDMGHSHLEIHFNTNGTIPVSKFEKYLPHFRKVSLNVSIDAHGKRDEYIRWNTKWVKKEKNIHDYLLLQKDYGKGKFFVGLNPTIQSLNIGYLDELYDYGQQLGIKINPGNIVWSPVKHNAQHLPIKIKKHYIEKLKQYDFPTVEGVLQSVEGDHKIFLSLLNDMKIMDQKRQIKFLDLWPEFEEYC